MLTLTSQTSQQNVVFPRDVWDDVVELSFDVDLSQLSISDSLASSDESLLLISSFKLSDVDADDDVEAERDDDADVSASLSIFWSTFDVSFGASFFLMASSVTEINV